MPTATFLCVVRTKYSPFAWTQSQPAALRLVDLFPTRSVSEGLAFCAVSPTPNRRSLMHRVGIFVASQLSQPAQIELIQNSEIDHFERPIRVLAKHQPRLFLG